MGEFFIGRGPVMEIKVLRGRGNKYVFVSHGKFLIAGRRVLTFYKNSDPPGRNRSARLGNPTPIGWGS